MGVTRVESTGSVKQGGLPLKEDGGIREKRWQLRPVSQGSTGMIPLIYLGTLHVFNHPSGGLLSSHPLSDLLKHVSPE